MRFTCERTAQPRPSLIYNCFNAAGSSGSFILSRKYTSDKVHRLLHVHSLVLQEFIFHTFVLHKIEHGVSIHHMPNNFTHIQHKQRTSNDGNATVLCYVSLE